MDIHGVTPRAIKKLTTKVSYGIEKGQTSPLGKLLKYYVILDIM